ncbi:DUF2157 domain-containing protein [Pseudodesulfovibrio sediminis]|uniref:DUF2157 domain-containing protein n=1 Tax=Pseudodesulfovibrio sediminis TaxID=2810563 RepID=A0ABM7P8L4_9BACT|nr:DUF2157 domain-containing protein [Pseudodesulfovibrio sediminis]BCS89335.1 hypothetical protein PSDVSF_25770 [Pseudodesulfovibrio sediminis]
MKFTNKDLDWAVEKQIIAAETRDDLVAAFAKKYEHKPSLSFANILFYLGGFIIIMSMTMSVGSVWDDLGGGSHLLIALLYALVFLSVGNRLWRKGQRIPGGILITAAVCMTPVAVWGFQEIIGLWVCHKSGIDLSEWMKAAKLFMYVATVITGLVALRFYRFPFITMPIACALWFMVEDIVPLIFYFDIIGGGSELISVWFGLAMVVGSFLIDRRTEEDFAFWGYLFGMIAFWGGLTNFYTDQYLHEMFFYCCINVGLMIVSVLLQRRIFVIFGSIGVLLYLGLLADRVSNDFLGFSIALSVIGLVVMFLGFQYHKHKHFIEEKVIHALPEGVRNTLPQYRRR